MGCGPSRISGHRRGGYAYGPGAPVKQVVHHGTCSGYGRRPPMSSYGGGFGRRRGGCPPPGGYGGGRRRY
ncbi:hypothetical protein K469DRAFT_699166 [Zopfia rhizophila CBS 207.26]|uniref:Uncharacterized protein n=1 Tax=Zopfia rhizophila CBS 207.26 TaxID=1314779 RepID=A0A6A6EX20_9PEZI|nr:hypothetical protein K469DRAFT_699166 [Zopfia rhizophila CBS 207.26]